MSAEKKNWKGISTEQYPIKSSCYLLSLDRNYNFWMYFPNEVPDIIY